MLRTSDEVVRHRQEQEPATPLDGQLPLRAEGQSGRRGAEWLLLFLCLNVNPVRQLY